MASYFIFAAFKRSIQYGRKERRKKRTRGTTGRERTTKCPLLTQPLTRQN
jgi:hypothetical protein